MTLDVCSDASRDVFVHFNICIQKQLIHFKKAAMLEPSYVDAFINWGVALSIAHRNEEAIAVLTVH